MSDLTIIRANDSHIDAIFHLLEQVLEVHADGRPDLFKTGSTKYTRDELSALLKDDSRPVFVACDEEGHVLGHCFCVIEEHNSNNEVHRCELYIDDLCIDEASRGKHVGEALYNYVKDYARELGCYRVTLHVWECNEGAKRFYEAMELVPYMIGMEEIL